MSTNTHPQKPETAHTPGPWLASDEVTVYDGGLISPHVYALAGEARGYVVALTGGTNLPGRLEEAKANARLIASAPELLAVMKDIVRHHPEQMFHVAACSAIARSEGRAT